MACELRGGDGIYVPAWLYCFHWYSDRRDPLGSFDPDPSIHDLHVTRTARLLWSGDDLRCRATGGLEVKKLKCVYCGQKDFNSECGYNFHLRFFCLKAPKGEWERRDPSRPQRASEGDAGRQSDQRPGGERKV